MSFDIKNDTVTVNDITYSVEREPSRSHMYDILTIEEFPGIEARVGHEEYIEDYMNPRSDCDGVLSVMVTEYRGYTFGRGPHDENNVPDFEIECVHCDGTGETIGPDNMIGGFLVRPPSCPYCEGVGMVDVDPATWARKTHGARVVLPLFVYEHSGITMSAGARIKAAATRDDFETRNRSPFDAAGWDTSAVGILFDTAETRKECGVEDWTDAQIEESMRSEVNEYDEYLRGNVHYYSVEDEESDYSDSCGGFLGDEKYVLAECFSSIESAVEKRLREMTLRAEAAARGIETI